jgi:predicted nucleic acid-binding protein
MVLLDSNIVIYLRDPSYGDRIVIQLGERRLGTCNIVVTEVLGYSALGTDDTRQFEQLFGAMKNHPFDERVTRKAIELRRARPMQLPDAIIAATAIVNDLELWTHNTGDFQNVPDLRLFDPL